ncbi:MAG: glyoxalase [Tildeniella nuda ZEHNDER 1965/U140]|jgi:hypothetical protein|nr:glyoxalase [Tildeniella nuda ZEHNDER 1965/U140]
MPILFHLSFPVGNIPQTKAFYADGLGCGVGRENVESVILDLYGHQLVAHVVHEPLTLQKGIYPRHFGLIFTAEVEWEALLERSQQNDLTFYQQAKHRFPGLPLEHRTFFLQDPFYNLMEFKFYRQAEAIFGSHDSTQIGDTAGV